MIWPSRISSNAIVAALMVGALPLPIPAAIVSGSVQPINARAGGKNRDYSGVVVWLEPSDGATPVLKPKTVQMIQKNKRFVPRVLAVPLGTTVSFPNLDPIFHNVFSNFSGQVFDLGLYSPGKVPAVRFQRTGFVRVFCNIHASMSAVIAVLPSPYLAISDTNGSFTFRDVPPGEYRFHVFHERSTGESLQALDAELTVGHENITLAPMRLSESDSVQVPHKNKYGRDYPPVVEDRPMYPAGAKR